MSFSGKVKEELAGQFSPARHCQVAEMAALLCGCGHVEKMSDGNIKLWIQTENEAVARKSFTLLRKTFNIETAIVIREGSHLKRGKVYLVEVADPQRAEEILQGTKLSVNNKTGLLEMDNSFVVQMNCCKRAFIRGTFLSSGSISDPEKGYHFEIVCPDRGKAEQLQGIIRSFHVEAKIVVRKKSYVVYVKEGAQIVDMLAVMEANVALMDLENIRILIYHPLRRCSRRCTHYNLNSVFPKEIQCLIHPVKFIFSFFRFINAPCKFTDSDHFDICFNHHLRVYFPALFVPVFRIIICTNSHGIFSLLLSKIKFHRF